MQYAGTWPKKPDLPLALNSTQKQILEGGLLGDSSLFSYENHVNAGLVVRRQAKDRDYLNYEYETFKEFCNHPPREQQVFDLRTKKAYSSIYFRTRLAPVFTEQRKRWYTDGIKIVPDDLVLTPLVCAIWFADDGSAVLKHNKDGTQALRMSLYTDGFSHSEVRRLCCLLSEVIGARLKTTTHDKNLIIYGGRDESLQLARYIDSAFPSSMERKSVCWRTLL